MEIEFKDEPVFIMAALCLFFPVGLFLLIRAEMGKMRKLIFGFIGGVVFFGLLGLALLNQPKPVNHNDFRLIITRQTLSVGQSGGFALTNGDDYVTDYAVQTENNAISVHGNVYTAKSTGSCTITVTTENISRQVTVTITDDPPTDGTVLASPTATRYHLTTAKHAGNKAVLMTEEEALLSGKTPCKNCYK